MQERFHSIVVHGKPHLDEIAAIWLLRMFGEEKFPGISTATVVFWGNGGETPDGRTAEDYEREGTLLIGVGGGRFDEHPAVNSKRKQDESATTLVAKAIGVDGEPALKKIFEYVTDEDLNGSSRPFDLAHLVKLLHKQYPDNPEKAMEWATAALEAKYREQMQFWAAKEEYGRIAQVEEVPGPEGKSLRVASIVSDNVQMSEFARSNHGGNAAIVILKRSSGNVQIFTNKRFKLDLCDVVRMIRLAEQRAKGLILTSDWRELMAEGKVAGAEEWFYHLTGQMLLNGSLTATDVPPSQIALEDIRRIVSVGINPNAFEPERSPGCKEGICDATRESPCPWYGFGLQRCQKIRYGMAQRRQR